jgi:uncharacterized protein (TIGR02118 family)
MFALVLFHDPAPGIRLAEADLAALHAALREVPALDHAMVYTPAAARDAYVEDGTPPPLGVQLHFARLEAMEEAAEAGGVLAGLPDLLPSLAGTRATAQAFWRRTWTVPDEGPDLPRRCSFVVHYPGPAQDMNAWLAHYIAGHPPLFQRLPGIRGIEILTRVDWVSGLPHEKVQHMQRNRVVFDDPAALEAALQSPVRHELRADFHTFPPFEGGNFHYPMWTETIRPGGGA